MRTVIVLLLLLASPAIAQVNSYVGRFDNQYSRRTVYFRPSFGYDRTHVRGTDRLELSGTSANNRFGWRRPNAYSRQARFGYNPYYPRLSMNGSVVRKPSLAPVPIAVTPLHDPFYEEKVLENALRDGSGYYPEW